MESINQKSLNGSELESYKGRNERYNYWSKLPMLSDVRLMAIAQKTLSEEKVTFVSSFILPQEKDPKSITQQIKKGKDLIFIPIILKNAWSSFGRILPKSLIPNHLVVITVDKENKLVEYFDPKGKNPFDETRSINGFESSLTILLSICNRALENGRNTVDYSPVAFQTDSSSCGYFGAHFMQLRSSQSFAKVINTKIDITATRKAIDALYESSVYADPEEFPDTGTSTPEIMSGKEIDEMFE